jgi:hypothetical protein
MANRISYMIITNDPKLANILKKKLEEWRDYVWWKWIVREYDDDGFTSWKDQKPTDEKVEMSAKTKEYM